MFKLFNFGEINNKQAIMTLFIMEFLYNILP